jgi:hypothetical protein
VSAPAPSAAATPGDPASPASPRRSPRAWFRRRLDRDPRRWVVAIAGLDGLVAFAFNVHEKGTFYDGRGVGLIVALAFAAVAPALGVLAMLAHGRLLLWTGRLLGGRAAAREIHAAFAWSQLPFAVVASPLLLEIPLRALAAEADPVPGWLAAALDGVSRAAGPVSVLAAVAALAGALLYLAYLAEAQRFSWWRALANHLLAAVLGIALLAAGALGGWGLFPDGSPLAKVALALSLTVVPALAVERVVTARRRAAAPTRGA